MGNQERFLISVTLGLNRTGELAFALTGQFIFPVDLM
jgi:hypothetical protein